MEKWATFLTMLELPVINLRYSVKLQMCAAVHANWSTSHYIPGGGLLLDPNQFGFSARQSFSDQLLLVNSESEGRQ